MRYLLAKINNNNQCSIINQCMYEKSYYKSSTSKNDLKKVTQWTSDCNQTFMVIFHHIALTCLPGVGL